MKNKMNNEFLDQYNIIIMSINDKQKIKFLVNGKKWNWVYIGENPFIKLKISKILRDNSNVNYSKEFQRVSLASKGKFIDLVSEIGLDYNQLRWWGTAISCKSPFLSNFFLYFCYITLISEWVRDNVEKRLIIVENPWVLLSCYQNFQRDKVCVILNNWHQCIESFKIYFLSFLKIFIFLFRSISLWLLMKTLFILNYKRLQSILSQDASVLICTYIADYSFNKGENALNDPYFGNLIDFYKRIEVKFDIITMLFIPIHNLIKIYNSKERVIVLSYFLRFGDILKSVYQSVFAKLRKVSNDKGLNIEEILKHEFILEKYLSCYSFLQYYTWFNAGQRLQKDSYCTLIYFFENQPWEKMMILGLRNSGFSLKIVGYQHTVIPPLLLNYFIGQEESHRMPQPDLIVSNGEYFRSILDGTGYSCRIMNGGSIRFSNINKEIKLLPKSKNNQKIQVLVILSPLLYRSIDLLFFIFRIALKNLEVIFQLKSHPDLPCQALKKHIKNMPSNISFVKGRINDLLDKVDFVIHIGGAVAIESLIRKIKTFKYLQERIDLDPLLNVKNDQIEINENDPPSFIFLKEEYETVNSSIITESFNEEFWKELVNNNYPKEY